MCTTFNCYEIQNEIFGSAYGTAVFLSTVSPLPPGKKVFIIGQDGIKDELQAKGIPLVDPLPIDKIEVSDDFWNTLQPDDDVGAVVCGFDIDINYATLARAHTYLTRVEGCRYILTNDDTTFPAAGCTFPGTGALAAALTTSTGRQPVVIGKPHATLLDCISQAYNLDRERTCMIGDRLDTDIQFGINGGLDTLLVLTGVTKEEQLHNPENQIVPTYVMKSLGHIAHSLTSV
ncbi:hypothetical protein IWQ61_001284 [Dispira simplex]|nr:hypothetical protein IWQ61_001284 [Dispira simplex]